MRIILNKIRYYKNVANPICNKVMLLFYIAQSLTPHISINASGATTVSIATLSITTIGIK